MRRKEKTLKMKFRHRVMAFAAVLVMMLSLISAVPVQAENIAPTTNLTTTFKKYLVMDENANVPDVDFTFTISAGNAVSANGSRVIYAGDDSRVTGFPVLKVDGTGSTTSIITAFNSGDTTYNSVEAGDTVTLDSGQKYAKKTVEVDFGNVDFNAPGIYRYVITENENTQDGITDDNILTRTLDVFVEYENENSGQLIVSDYILYPGTKTDSADVPSANKDDGFTNTYTTHDLTLEKQVTGNQGDRDKYFEFTVEITNAVKETVYTVDLQNADANPTVDEDVKTNADTLNATDGTVTSTYYLKDDQSIVIQGLTAGTNYTITETGYTSDGYETSYVIDTNTKVDNSDTGAQIMGENDHKVTFTNNKEGTVPTGILLETAPYIVLGVVVLVGLAILFMTGRRRVR